MKRAGQASPAGKAEKVANGSFNREEGYLYFLDSHGDVSRAKRAVGGQKRKKTKADRSRPPRGPGQEGCSGCQEGCSGCQSRRPPPKPAPAAKAGARRQKPRAKKK